MSNNLKQYKMTLTEDTFDELYKPQQNHIDDNASWNGTLFETYGKELDYVLEFANHFKKQKRVWTLIETDGKQYVTAGYHLVNRLGYFITEKEWEDGTEEFEVEGVCEELIYDLNRIDYSDTFWKDNASDDIDFIMLNHCDLSITNYGDLQKFLLDDANTTNEMDEAIKDSIPNVCVFEFKGDEEGLGFILDIWATEEDRENGDVLDSYTFWFDDYN